jgi:hypothetical protein
MGIYLDHRARRLFRFATIICRSSEVDQDVVINRVRRG